MEFIDNRLEKVKLVPRAMRSYVMTLYELICEIRPENVLEIGVQRGQSTKAILLAMAMIRHGHLTSVDHKDRSGLLNDIEHKDLEPYWTFVHGNSHLEETKNQVLKGYDILFLDGDHKYDGVKQDWNDYMPMVVPGGLVLMHDVTNKNEGVKDLWAEIKYEKFAFNWGRAGGGVIPGFGFVRKPMV